MNVRALLDDLLGPGLLGLLSTTPRRELAAYAAVVITLLGVRLCWRAPRYRMSMEERAKDGRLTEDEARRRITFIAWLGPSIAIFGCGLLAAALLK